MKAVTDETSQMNKETSSKILCPQKELSPDSEVQLNTNIKYVKRRQRKGGKEGQRGEKKKNILKKSMPKQKTGRKLTKSFLL